MIRRLHRRVPITFAVAILLAVGVIASYVIVRPRETINVQGSLSLILTRFAVDDLGGQKPANCSGIEGFSDITGGAGVVVRDPSGKTIGVGKLQSGVPSGEVRDGTLEEIGVATECVFRFTISKVPAEDFYSIEVGHRGAVIFTREQAARGAKVTLDG